MNRVVVLLLKLAVISLILFFNDKTLAKENTSCVVHFFLPESCTTPQICKYCGYSIGNSLGHDFKLCDEKYVCSRCGLIK